MRDQFDRSSKWLIQHHGNSILSLGGIDRVSSWRPLQAEVVQPRQLPDGLLEVQLIDRPQPILFLLEIATYPERRLQEQIIGDTMLVYLDRKVLPEVLSLVLQPKGNLRIPGTQALSSPHGLTRMRIDWRSVELWNVPAEQLLAADDVGLIPWVPLTHFEAPPEVMLQECRQRIDQQAAVAEHANLLAVTQVLARLRYPDPQLLSLFGGRKIMIESPLIQELLAERMRQAIQKVLTGRFQSVPSELMTLLQAIQEETKLDELVVWAARCPDLESFRARLGP